MRPLKQLARDGRFGNRRSPSEHPGTGVLEPPSPPTPLRNTSSGAYHDLPAADDAAEAARMKRIGELERAVQALEAKVEELDEESVSGSVQLLVARNN